MKNVIAMIIDEIIENGEENDGDTFFYDSGSSRYFYYNKYDLIEKIYDETGYVVDLVYTTLLPEEKTCVIINYDYQ